MKWAGVVREQVGYHFSGTIRLLVGELPVGEIADWSSDMIAMLLLRHHDYQSNFDFNKNKKYVESSESDQIHKEGKILIWNLWF